MKKFVKIFSIIVIFVSFLILFIIKGIIYYDKTSQNKIIDNIYVKKIDYNQDYLGYIYIPKYNIKRLIKEGTSSDILNANYVGMHDVSSSFSSGALILAGHNTSNVFGILHDISVNDIVYIINEEFEREFMVYNKIYVNEYEMHYLYDVKDHELLLITCSNKKGERLLVMLKEVL